MPYRSVLSICCLPSLPIFSPTSPSRRSAHAQACQSASPVALKGANTTQQEAQRFVRVAEMRGFLFVEKLYNKQVLEENAIVSEITFGETSSGAAIVSGSYIGPNSSTVGRFGPRGQRSVESREQTLANGKRRIMGIANGLNLPDRVSDSAYRLFILAVSNRFVQGRRSEYVTASCLYVACRMEKTSHMLIDFSDFLHINVFVLGATYLKLVKELQLYGQIPQVDPSLFISRFAQLLEFGDETQGVAHDAIRLVQRFNRDWMDTGRRPAGICGAALLLAARMNNFRRSIDEVVQVVKIADVTLRKRLEEFKATPSGEMTVANFRALWLEDSADPPAYVEGIRRETLKNEMAEVARLEKLGQDPDGNLIMENAFSEVGRREEASTSALVPSEKAQGKQREPEIPFGEIIDPAIAQEISTSLASADGLAISTELEQVEQQRLQQVEDSRFDDLDDDELDRFILTKDEAAEKERIWMELNKDYLEAMAEKHRAQEGEDRPVKKPRNSNRKRKQREESVPQATAAEATKQMITQKKKFSRRLNYAVVDGIFEPGALVTARSQKRQRQGSEEEPATPRNASPRISKTPQVADVEEEDEEIQDVDWTAVQADGPLFAPESEDEDARPDEDADNNFQNDEDAFDLDDLS